MTNTLYVGPVDSPDELLNAGAYGAGAVIRVQSGAAVGGPFADISGTGSTPTLPIVAGTHYYTGFDPNGTAATWYRTRYENAGATRVSAWLAPFLVAAPALCSEAQVKARLGIADTVDDPTIGEIIGAITDEIAHYTGRQLGPENGVTYVFDTALGHRLAIPRGIRAVTSMGIAATDQPDAAGSYLAVTLADVLLRPVPADRRPGWPATELLLKSGPIDVRIPFRSVANGATITGDFGFPVTPPAVNRIALNACVAEYLDRRRAGQAGPEGIELPRLLAGDELATLARYRAGAGIGIG